MTVRPFGWAALMGLALVSGRSAVAGEPPRLGLPTARPMPSVESGDAQKLADTIVACLRQSGQLHNYRVDVAVDGGNVELTGSVVDQPQREEVLRLVQGLPGVVRVVDHLSLTTGCAVIRAQAEGPDLPPKLPADPDKPRLPEPLPNHDKGNGSGEGAGAEAGKKGIGEPTPVFRGPIPGNLGLNPPAMPPYAWPTYAPYNNFSRVAAPKAYPYNAWPFIGPVYPFPKIPVGWRKVKLEWDDGYWWYGRVGCPYDWWKIRYW